MQAKTVKETMDKKFAPNWHCFIGQGFGFEVVCFPFLCCLRACAATAIPALSACSGLRVHGRRSA